METTESLKNRIAEAKERTKQLHVNQSEPETSGASGHSSEQLPKPPKVKIFAFFLQLFDF